MTIPHRHAIRILLLNQQQQLLLMCANDASTRPLQGQPPGRYWFTTGGQIEKGESVQSCALRELFEETGLKETEITLGPVVWTALYDLILLGQQTRMHEQFIVAHTTKSDVKMTNPTDVEVQMVEQLAWFDLQAIRESHDVIYPLGLDTLLEPILAGHYPETPIDISQAKD